MNTQEIVRQIVAQNQQILDQNAVLLATLGADEPARVTRPAKAPKAAKPQVKAAKAPKVTHLTRSNRKAFVQAHPWAKGLSTQVIAAMATEDPSLLSAGWAIGERYTAMFSA